MLYAPGPKGRLLRHLFVSLLAPPVPMRRTEMSRGGPTEWGAERPLTSEDGALPCAACEGGKQTSQQPAAVFGCQGVGGRAARPTRPKQEAWGFAGRTS